MTKRIGNTQSPVEAAFDVQTDSTDVGVRIRPQGTGNAIEVVSGTSVLWSVDAAGNPSSGSGGTADYLASYVIYKTGASFAATSPIGLTAVAANADAAAVFQSCLNNINSSTTPRGLIIFAPNTTFTWNSVPLIRRTYASGGSDDHKWLQILGSGGSVIQFGTGKEFANFNRQADFDGFCGIEVGYLTFDGNNASVGAAGRGSTCLGQFSNTQRVDLRRIYVHDIESYNVVTETAASGAYRSFCNLTTTHLGASEGTQSQITDITFERIKISGGNGAIAVTGGGGAAGVNIYGDRIRISDIWFDNGIAAGSQSTYAPSSQIQVGSWMFGDRMVIERCWLAGSGDDGIEVNNFRTTVVRDCHMSKTVGVGGYAAIQFNFLNGVDNSNATSQVILFDNCTYEHVAGMEASASDRAFAIDTVGTNGCDMGTIIYKNCVSYCSGVLQSTPAEAGGAFYFASGVAHNVDRVILDGCTVDHFFNVASGAHDVRPIWYYKMARELVIRNLKITLRGAQTGGTYAAKPLFLNGQNKARLDIDGVTVNDLTTGRSAGLTQIIFLGSDSTGGANDFGGTIRRVIQLASVDTGVQMIWIAGTGTLTLRKLLIEDCDSSRLAASAEDVKFQSAGQNEAPVFIRNMKGRVDPPVEIAFTPGATTVAAQYLGHYEGNMTLTGGTVTVVSVSTDNVTFRQVAAGTNVSFYVDHGHWIKLTYTVVPTCAVIPRR